jgi:dienelactone hydrolase
MNRFAMRSLICLLILGSLGACGAGASVSHNGPTAPASVFNYDPKAPLGLQVVSSEKQEGITVQTITYVSPKGGRVPAALLIPAGKGPFAGMLLMHGAPGEYQQMVPEGKVLARRGAVVLLIDAPFSRPGQEHFPFTFSETDRKDQIQLIIDLRRGVDLLLARRDVDPKRLGYLGISYGGAMGGLFAGVEKRLKVYALVVGDGGLVSHLTGPDDTNGEFRQLPAEQAERWRSSMEPIEPIRWVGRAAPAHLLFQSGRRDEFVPPSDAKAYQEAGSEPKKILWYDAGHGLNKDAVRDRHAWLAAELGIRSPEPAWETAP